MSRKIVYLIFSLIFSFIFFYIISSIYGTDEPIRDICLSIITFMVVMDKTKLSEYFI